MSPVLYLLCCCCYSSIIPVLPYGEIMALLRAGPTPGATVTQLKFVSANASAPGVSRHRRLALRDGWRLEGNLHTLGYFSGARAVHTNAVGMLHVP